jgi:alpha-L-fucosidase
MKEQLRELPTGYGTTASPFERMPFFGRATVRGNRLFLHVFQWPRDGKLLVPGLKNLVSSARLLADPKQPLRTSRDGAGVVIELPATAPDEIAAGVEVTLDGALQVEPWLIQPAADGSVFLGVESSEIETRFEQRAKKGERVGPRLPHAMGALRRHPNVEIQSSQGGTVQSGYHLRRRARLNRDRVHRVGGERATCRKSRNRRGDWVFKTFSLGEMKLDAGEQTLQVKAATRGTSAMNIESVRLIPAGK